MSLSPALSLQQAVLAALAGSNAVVAALPTYTYNPGTANAVTVPAIFDRVPQNPPFPFIHIGDHQLTGMVYERSGATDCHVNIHAFSRYQGKSEILTLEGLIRDAMSNALVLSGFNTVTSYYVQSRFPQEPDGLTEHCIVEFDVKVNA